jgi:hypothetical protein
MQPLGIERVLNFIKENNLPIKILSKEFKTAKSKLKFQCEVDGYIYERPWDSFRRYPSCPKCSNLMKRTTDEVIEYINGLNQDIKLVSGEYVNSKSCFEILCTIHDYKFSKAWNSIQQSNTTLCPICSRRLVVSGINDVYTLHPEMLKFFVNIEDAKVVGAGSDTVVMAKCDLCESIKSMPVHRLFYQGFGCGVCSDHISHPNKLVRSVLSAKGVDFNFEKRFDWGGNYRYDAYIRSVNTIIEMHGQQHYRSSSFGDLSEIQNIDDIKRSLALSNGISHYVEIDCSSEDTLDIYERLKNGLEEIIDISGVNLEWLELESRSSLLKKILEIREQNPNISQKEVATMLHTGTDTIRKYLKKYKDAKGESYGKKIW